MTKVFTISFTKKSAESFFNRLQEAGVKKVIDVRLNNISQLAGFAKKDDLRYFLKAIGGIDYAQQIEFAPTQEMLDAYKKQRGEWADYEKRFLALMADRKIEEVVSRQSPSRACFLCSEDKPHHCHRRLIAEYLNQKLCNLDIAHL